MKKNYGKFFLMVGPSRVGKNAIIKGLLRKKSLRLKQLVTMTDRLPRPGEKNGVDYFFVTPEQFQKNIKNGTLIEWEKTHVNHYGTPGQPFFSWIKQGYNVIADIDVKGAKKWMKDDRLEAVTIFVLPKTISELKQRLRRGTQSRTEAAVRWETAKRELKEQPFFDYRIINEQGKLNSAIKEVAEIIKAHTK